MLSSKSSEQAGAPVQRRWVTGAFVASAALGLAGGWWWRDRQLTVKDTLVEPAASEEAMMVRQALANAAVTGLDGSPLVWNSLLKQPLLINIWATWCPPCVEEMPLIDAFYQQNKAKGIQVLAIAADKMEPVQRFLRQHQLSLPVAVGGMGVIDLTRQLGNLSGSLPFSVMLDGQQRVVQRKLGKLTPADLDLWRQV